MIVSHAHKFIYVKTYKTASTSIEAALSAVCGADDIITEASETLRGHRQRAAQNYRLSHPLVPPRPMWRTLLGRPERFYHPSIGYYEHMPAWRIRAYLGEEIWRSYFKFSFERNPWDRQVSWYYYKTKNKSGNAKPAFAAFNADRKRAYVENWELYTIENKVCLDFVGRYEALETGFAAILSHVGLTGAVTLPAVNVARDGSKQGAYRSFYDDESRAMIARWYAREITHFDYSY